MKILEFKAINIEDKNEVLNRLKASTKYEGDCWLWTELRIYGYGYVKISGKRYRISRLSMYIFEDLDLNNPETQALHRLECPNKHCWNPKHLYIGSHWDNMKDVSKVIQSKDIFKFCGHPRTEENKYYVGGSVACRICIMHLDRKGKCEQK